MKLTPEMAQRYDDGNGIALSDPCVICGAQPTKCGHWESRETEDVCRRLKLLGKAQRDKLRKGQLS